MLTWQPGVAGRGRMGAEQLAGLFGKTAVLDCCSQIDQTEKRVVSLAGSSFHQVSGLIWLASQLQDVKE